MKKKLFIVLAFLVCLPIFSFANPVEKTECSAGEEFAKHLLIYFKRGYFYGDLIIHRKAENSDYKRNLSTFKGGRYRLNLAERGGITGLTIQFKKDEMSEFESVMEPLNCNTDTVARVEQVENIPLTKDVQESPERKLDLSDSNIFMDEE